MSNFTGYKQGLQVQCSPVEMLLYAYMHKFKISENF